MARYKKRKLGFTITELISVLILLFFVSFAVISHTIEQEKQKQNIEKIKDTYSLIEKATTAWQIENDCQNDIKICIKNEKAKKGPMFNGIAKYLPVVAATTNLEAKGRTITAEELQNIDWLPENTLTFSGNTQKTAVTGVSKYLERANSPAEYYQLKNGVTISVNLPDLYTNTGFGFFDINGKAAPNKIGVDVFPFSFGADLYSNNLLYDTVSKKFNPYYAGSSIYTNADMCNITSNACTSDDIPSNPTAYVLKMNKLPK